MTDRTDAPRAFPPSVASSRSWWFGGDFWGVRYEAAFDIRFLEPGPPGGAADLLRVVAPPEADPRPGRTQVEAWEDEGGAVVDRQVGRRSRGRESRVPPVPSRTTSV